MRLKHETTAIGGATTTSELSHRICENLTCHSASCLGGGPLASYPYASPTLSKHSHWLLRSQTLNAVIVYYTLLQSLSIVQG